MGIGSETQLMPIANSHGSMALLGKGAGCSYSTRQAAG